MEDEIQDDANISKEQDMEESNTSEGDVSETSESDNDLQDRLAKAEQLANNYKIRAEKAERFAKQKSEQIHSTSQTNDLSPKDIYALMDAKVPQEDIDDVVEYATLKKISIGDALKSNIVKVILSDKSEQRRTASATNVGAARRGSSKISDDVLLEKASKGDMPQSDDEILRLVKARKGLK